MMIKNEKDDIDDENDCDNEEDRYNDFDDLTRTGKQFNPTNLS